MFIYCRLKSLGYHQLKALEAEWVGTAGLTENKAKVRENYLENNPPLKSVILISFSYSYDSKSVLYSVLRQRQQKKRHGWFSCLSISKTIFRYPPTPPCYLDVLFTCLALIQPFLVPLARTVQRLLEVVLHDCGIARAVECDGAGLQSTLTAAFTESGVTVDVKVEYGG